MPCLKPAELRFVHDPLTRWLWQYLFPIQFILGVLGNVLNLCVLVSDETSNVASDLLAAVSFCDLAFLLVMLPHALSSYDTLAFDDTFRFFYLKSKQHIAAVANWMSAAAIWLILAVSVERFLIIRSPLRSKLYWQRGKMVLVLSSIFFATGLLTLYHHFEYDCTLMEFCNGSQLIDFCYYAGEKHPRTFLKKELILPSEVKKVYMRVMTIFNAVLVVFAPILLVILLNMLMMRELRFNDLSVLETFRGSVSRNQHRQRRRVTVTVIAIGLCFSLTQGPSAVMVIWELFAGYAHLGATFYAIFSITNSLVVTGKTINFILFCLSSEHFRRKCFILLFRKFPRLSQSSLGQRLSVYTKSNSADVRGSLRTLNSYRRSSVPTLRDQRESAARESLITTNALRAE
ncbi:7 transmembrane receptor [Trichostrongylus colubriformis]|uniref:7 transmembrane receptor n=1 Tax=Trichostrongylus colubriformis TaxID=6319 RepID=A0AAN8FCQ0_TRICO